MQGTPYKNYEPKGREKNATITWIEWVSDYLSDWLSQNKILDPRSGFT